MKFTCDINALSYSNLTNCVIELKKHCKDLEKRIEDLECINRQFDIINNEVSLNALSPCDISDCIICKGIEE